MAWSTVGWIALGVVGAAAIGVAAHVVLWSKVEVHKGDPEQWPAQDSTTTKE